MRAWYFLLLLLACKKTPAAQECSDACDQQMSVDMSMTGMPSDMQPGDTPCECPTGPVAETGPTGPTAPTMPMTPTIVDAEFGLDARPVNTQCIARTPPPATGTLKFTNVTGFNQGDTIMAMRALRHTDGARYWFVAYREGLVRSYRQASDLQNSVDAGSDVLDLRSIVSTQGEGGLLGMALGPDGRMYVTYTRAAGDGVCPPEFTHPADPAMNANYNQLCLYLVRFTLTQSTQGNGAAMWTASGETLIPIKKPSEDTDVTGWIRKPDDNHNGGGLTFGKPPDNNLYMSTGDGGDSDDTFLSGQNTNSALGKVLRINATCDDPATCELIPADNPVVGAPGATASLIYAYGLRNPWRIWTDRGTGDIWVADVGQGSWEEVDRLVAGGNHGWRVREGNHCRGSLSTDLSGCPLSNAVAPIAEYDHSRGAIGSGGAVYRGARLADYTGRLFWGDFGSQEVWAVAPSSATIGVTDTPADLDADTGGGLTLYEDELGEMYAALGYSSSVYRIDPSSAGGASNFPTLLSETGCMNGSGLIPYDLNATLWSDDLTKRRWMALPEGEAITVAGDGDFDFPNGTVLVKEFATTQKKLETRLLMRDSTGTWTGYTYQWNDAQTDATLLADAQDTAVNDKGHAFTWTFPSRGQCMQCHTQAAGFSIGPRLSQLNRNFVYTSTSRRSNELKTLEHIGVIGAVAQPAPFMPDPFGASGTVEERARAYLDANCAHCHQPSGGTPANIDLRYGTALASTNACNADPQRGDTGLTNDPKILKAGAPSGSVLLNRMKTPAYRMPMLGTRLIHDAAVDLVDAWITQLQCF